LIPKPAQYLLRFDDLCPTLPRERWDEFRKLIDEFGVRPILAVVPANQDRDLERAPCNPAFWAEVRAMEAAGATIAMHGYRHVCRSKGKSLLNIHRRSEFAGVDLATQREWIQAGLKILHDQGLNPRLWVAPRHGFDRNTLRAMGEAGVEFISDGLARIPHRRYGITWIPQQLWAPVVKSKGLWTICIHPWAARGAEIESLRSFLRNHASQFTSFDRVVKEFDAKPLGLAERIHERVALWRIQRRNRQRRQMKRKR
jgi:predicted deacetylase